MPELPEVETIARQLNEVLPGRVVAAVDVRREKSAQTDLLDLVGRRIQRVGRRAKMVVVTFEDGDSLLLIHLKMTGQLIFQESEVGSQEPGVRVVGGHPTPDWVNTLPSSHTRIVISFVDGSVLYFNDMRVFGWMKLVLKADFKFHMSKLPPDVIDEAFSARYLAEQLARSARAVKLVILDQSKMGGMGNIYANDALWKARIHPLTPANTLVRKQIALLWTAMRDVLERGIMVGGASESTYKHINGMGGNYQEEFLIYKREGKTCGRDTCEGVIEKFKLGGRGTYFCPICQHL